MTYIAHVREDDGCIQTVREHLEGVADLSKIYAAKIGLGDYGELIGLVHDLGKYPLTFQNYIKSGTNLLTPEDAGFVNVDEYKGKIDHSTAGAQYIWNKLSVKGDVGKLIGKILFLCVCSHHSGLIDCLVPEPVANKFDIRTKKSEDNAHLLEAVSKAEIDILNRCDEIMAREGFITSLPKMVGDILKSGGGLYGIVGQFQIGLLTRYLFSGLIDADRTDTADFEKPFFRKFRLNGKYVPWEILTERVENKVQAYSVGTRQIDLIRNNVSKACFEAAFGDKGNFTLSVPTGGGKTISSLRFALQHAKKHNFERVLYISPFTSIIDQNADVVRGILEPDGSPQVVLEHHCNVVNERKNDNDETISKWKDKSRIWKDRLLTENWDAPVVFTTNVQFLEAFFGSGTRNVRRLHQLANSVIVFDEIQTLPIRCIHMFNNAINFLVDYCGCSAVLCTATQPLLHKVSREKGAIKNPSEIIPNVQKLFDDLKRVSVRDLRRPGGWTANDIAIFSKEQAEQSGSCLVILNTKKAAISVYKELNGEDFPIYHLSTNMCPTHRRKILEKVRRHLKNKERIICISTQLIEAGVDVDFGSVIRSVAGLDSIAQAGGRCNRNGERSIGIVSIINPIKELENLGPLDDIKKGVRVTERILDEYKENPDRFGNDIIGIVAMKSFYERYFFNRRNEMVYETKKVKEDRVDSLLEMLSSNGRVVEDYKRTYGIAPDFLRQSFSTAAKMFQPISSITTGVIVPFEDGAEIIKQLCGSEDVSIEFKLLKQAQQFTVNVYEQDIKRLTELGAIHPIQEGSSIFYLDPNYYNNDFGIC